MALAPVFVELKANIGEFQAKMGEAQHEIQKLATEGSRHFDKLQAVGKAALFGVAGAGLALGVMSVKAAMEGEQAHARLAQAIKNTGGSMEALEPKVNALSGRMGRLGFVNDQVELALATMTTATGSASKAMSMMGDAADLARYKHISLADAGALLARAQGGSMRAFKELGITLETGVPKTVALKDAMDELHRKIGGQAAASAQTFSGKIEVLKAQSENLAEKIGTHLIPIIESLVAKTMTIVAWFERHTTIAKALAAVVGGALVTAMAAYVVGQVASTVATTAFVARVVIANAVVVGFVAKQYLAAGAAKVWAAGQWLLNAALDANPIGLVIAAVAALTAGIVYAYTHSEKFRQVISAIVDFFKTVFRAELGLVTSAVHGLAEAFRAVFGAVGSVIDAIGKIHMPSFSLPHIPGFANGVTDFIGGPAWVGERGPELLTLPRGSNIIPNHALGGLDSSAVVDELRALRGEMRAEMRRHADSLTMMRRTA
jgi:phage-related protein